MFIVDCEMLPGIASSDIPELLGHFVSELMCITLSAAIRDDEQKGINMFRRFYELRRRSLCVIRVKVQY